LLYFVDNDIKPTKHSCHMAMAGWLQSNDVAFAPIQSIGGQHSCMHVGKTMLSRVNECANEMGPAAEPGIPFE